MGVYFSGVVADTGNIILSVRDFAGAMTTS